MRLAFLAESAMQTQPVSPFEHPKPIPEMGLKYLKMSLLCRNEEKVIRLDKMSNRVRQHVNNTECLCPFVLFVVNLAYSLG